MTHPTFAPICFGPATPSEAPGILQSSPGKVTGAVAFTFSLTICIACWISPIVCPVVRVPSAFRCHATAPAGASVTTSYWNYAQPEKPSETLQLSPRREAGQYGPKPVHGLVFIEHVSDAILLHIPSFACFLPRKT